MRCLTLELAAHMHEQKQNPSLFPDDRHPRDLAPIIPARRPDSRLEFNFRPPVEILICTCRSFRSGHSPELHRQLRADYDWRTFQQLEPLRREGDYYR